MSRTVTRSNRPPVANGALDAEPGVALIADENACEEIAEIVERERLSLDTFADLDSLLSSESEPSLVVVQVKDTNSPLSSFVEPLTQRFEQAPIVLACAEIERWEVRSALAAGAAGIVLHEDLDSALGPCLQAVLAGPH